MIMRNSLCEYNLIAFTQALCMLKSLQVKRATLGCSLRSGFSEVDVAGPAIVG